MHHLPPFICTKISEKMSLNKFKCYRGRLKILYIAVVPAIGFKIDCKISKQIKHKMELYLSMIHIYILKIEFLNFNFCY